MIEVKNLFKYYGHKKAVNGVNFTAKRGEVLGFIGQNGAGKSTTMRVITGFIPASEGSVLVDGVDIAEEPYSAKEKIGYLPESAPVYNNMTVQGFLKFCAEMRGFYKSERKRVVEEAIEACFLESVRHQTIDTLSKGYRHRTSLAQALLGNPDALILDEPTDGLDPNQKHEVRKLIRKLGKDKAIIISTHILEEVDAICDRLVLIDEGKVKFDGTPDEFRALGHLDGVALLTCKDITAEKMEAVFSQCEFVKEVEKTASHSVRIYPKDEDSDISYAIAHILLEHGWRATELTLHKGRLEDVFQQLTQTEESE